MIFVSSEYSSVMLCGCCIAGSPPKVQCLYITMCLTLFTLFILPPLPFPSDNLHAVVCVREFVSSFVAFCLCPTYE